MWFTIDDEHIIKWMWVKKYVEKRLLKMFLTEDEVDLADTDQNVSARSLTLLRGGVGVGTVWSTTAVTFSVKCLTH